jgi:hypothetical protein
MEPNFECAAQNGAELCRETAAVLCIMAKSDTAMTALGQHRKVVGAAYITLYAAGLWLPVPRVGGEHEFR